MRSDLSAHSVSLREYSISHHFSALAMCSCASLIFCAAMAHGCADEEDTDRPAAREDDDDDDGPLRTIRRLSRFSLELIHVTVFFYGSPSGKLQCTLQHLRFTIALFFINLCISIKYLLLLFTDRIYLFL